MTWTGETAVSIEWWLSKVSRIEGCRSGAFGKSAGEAMSGAQAEGRTGGAEEGDFPFLTKRQRPFATDLPLPPPSWHMEGLLPCRAIWKRRWACSGGLQKFLACSPSPPPRPK